MKRLETLLVCSILILKGSSVVSQEKNAFLKDIDKAKNIAIDSLMQFNKETNKLKYLALLPSINYNFFQNSFNVGISISNLANYYQTKQRNKIELEKLKFQLIEKKDNDIIHLEEEFELLLDDYDILKLELDNTTLTTEIFNLKKKQYDNNKITLEEWLNVQKAFQDKNLAVFAKRRSLISKMKHYETKTKSVCFKKEIDYLSINEKLISK